MKTIRLQLKGKDNRPFEVEFITLKGKVLSYIVVESDGLITDVNVSGLRGK